MFDGYSEPARRHRRCIRLRRLVPTGDAAVIDGDGMHRIVGRESVDLIKSGGYRMGAGEVETALLGHPGRGRSRRRRVAR